LDYLVDYERFMKKNSHYLAQPLVFQSEPFHCYLYWNK